MTRIRTIEQAYMEIKENDPNSSVSKSFIRILAKSGTIPTRKAGNKYLINLDQLDEFLRGEG